MQREIQLTADGSHTMAVSGGKGITYHSQHGAMAESMHVYMEAGLQPFLRNAQLWQISVLEVGFGTGLNCLLTLREAIKEKKCIHYTAIENYPVTTPEAEKLNYGELLSMQEPFKKMHAAEWEIENNITPDFILKKIQQPLEQVQLSHQFHCIYFDAFSPTYQPELWTEEIFSKLFGMLLPGGKLVTYSSKSTARKAMAAAGFSVKKIPGPHGKREMVVAERIH